MKNSVIELVTYKLKTSVTKEQLAATHSDVNTFLVEQPGFMHRSLSEDSNGLLYDIVYWQDMETAKSAGEAFMAHKAGQALAALTDESSISMWHMEALLLSVRVQGWSGLLYLLCLWVSQSRIRPVIKFSSKSFQPKNSRPNAIKLFF